MGEFTVQKDGKYAYSMLRPASWTPLDTVGRRMYVPSDTGDQPTISLSAINYHILANKSEQEQMIQQWLVFEENPTLEGWTNEMERVTATSRTRTFIMQLETTLTNARIYSVRGTPGVLGLVAYVVDQNQPLNVVLEADGASADIGYLQREGIFDDFITIVSSIHAIPEDPTIFAIQP